MTLLNAFFKGEDNQIHTKLWKLTRKMGYHVGMWIKRIMLLLIALTLNGCWLVYKPDIKQGNIIDPSKVSNVQAGMSKDQVIQILGYPVMVNPYPDEHRLIYVYSLQPGHGEFRAKQLFVYFRNDRVTNYSTAGQYP